MMDAKDICERYDAMVAKAIEVVHGGPPYWGFVYNQEWPRLSVDGDTATLRWCIEGIEYGAPDLGSEECSFPVRLLLIPAPELAAWKAKEAAKYVREQGAKKARDTHDAAVFKEDHERSEYARLKAKYEAEDGG